MTIKERYVKIPVGCFFREVLLASFAGSAMYDPHWIPPAFFADEKLTLPPGLDGIFELISNKEIRGVSLLLNGGQLSTIQLDAVPAIFGFTIKLNDDREFEGELLISLKGPFVQRWIHFQSPGADAGTPTVPIS